MHQVKHCRAMVNNNRHIRYDHKERARGNGQARNEQGAWAWTQGQEQEDNNSRNTIVYPRQGRTGKERAKGHGIS